MDIECSRMKRFNRSQSLRREEKEKRRKRDQLNRGNVNKTKESEAKGYDAMYWKQTLNSSVEMKNYDDFGQIVATIEEQINTNEEERQSIIDEIWNESNKSSIFSLIETMVKYKSQLKENLQSDIYADAPADAPIAISYVLCLIHSLIVFDKKISKKSISKIIDILSMYSCWINDRNMSIMISNICELKDICDCQTKRRLIGINSHCIKQLVQLMQSMQGNENSFENEMHLMLDIIFGFTNGDEYDTQRVLIAGGMDMIVASITYFGRNCKTMSKIMGILRNAIIDCKDNLSMVMKNNIISVYIWQCFAKGSYFVQIDAAYGIKYLSQYVDLRGFEIISKELENCARSVTARHELTRILLDIILTLTNRERNDKNNNDDKDSDNCDKQETQLQKLLQQTNLHSTIEQLALDENIDESTQGLATAILNKWNDINK